MRGRVSELAGGVIICKDKPPPASAKALAPPPEAGGEMISSGSEMIIVSGSEMIIVAANCRSRALIEMKLLLSVIFVI